MAHNINGTFVSEKINKVRWRPDFMNDCHFFITGSWDNDHNSIKLWDFQESEEDSEVYPFQVAEVTHKGDVTELQFMNADTFVASSTSGSVALMQISSDHGVDPLIETKLAWKDVHKFPTGELCPCTSVAVYETDTASAGEDGRVNLLSAQNKTVFRSLNSADSCGITCITFLKHSEILTGNMRGQLKIFDVRAHGEAPVSTFMLSGGDQVSPLCLQNHPTQRHLVVAGDEEGSVTIWDLRQNTYPVNLLDAHEGPVSEIHFHPDYPDQLFTCSHAGDVWHWSPKTVPSTSLTENNNVWLASETIKNKLDVFTLMPKLHKPINSLDVNRSKMLCGCDNEAVYLINGINIFH